MKNRFFQGIMAITLCLAVCFGMASCSADNEVMKIGDVTISRAIYSYWLSDAVQEYNRLPDNEKTSKEAEYTRWIRNKAYESCLEYATVKDKFNSLELQLTTEQKSSIAGAVVVDWEYWGDYFKSIGVKKSDYLKIYEYKEYKNSLFMHLYGSEGELAVTDEELQDYFKENYVLFNVIAGYKTERDAAGNVIQISEDNQAALKARFDNMAKKINDDTLTFDQVYYQYNSQVEITDDEVKEIEIDESMTSTPNIITKGNASYPETFFDDVSAMDDNTAKILEYDDYVYLVLKLDILDEDYDYLSNYRQSCLQAMKSSDYTKQLSEWENDLSEKIFIDENAVNEFDIVSYLERISK